MTLRPCQLVQIDVFRWSSIIPHANIVNKRATVFTTFSKYLKNSSETHILHLSYHFLQFRGAVVSPWEKKLYRGSVWPEATCIKWFRWSQNSSEKKRILASDYLWKKREQNEAKFITDLENHNTITPPQLDNNWTIREQILLAKNGESLNIISEANL